MAGGTINFDPHLKIEIKIFENIGMFLSELILQKTWCGPASPRLCLHWPPCKLSLRPWFGGSWCSCRHTLSLWRRSQSFGQGKPLWWPDNRSSMLQSLTEKADWMLSEFYIYWIIRQHRRNIEKRYLQPDFFHHFFHNFPNHEIYNKVCLIGQLHPAIKN